MAAVMLLAGFVGCAEPVEPDVATSPDVEDAANESVAPMAAKPDAAPSTDLDAPAPKTASTMPLASDVDGGQETPTTPLTQLPQATDADEPLSDGLDGGGGPAPATVTTQPEASLEQQLAAFEIPPRWLEDVTTSYDTSHEWKDARLEIRRLLGLGKPETHREALKLTWLYLQKDDIGDGHEYPMYTFLGGEPLWSIVAHREFLARPHENTPIHAHLSLASLYIKYGAFEQARETLEVAMKSLPEPPWRTMREADILVALGDVYAAWGQADEAKKYYAQAAETYPKAKPPYGGHLLPRRAAEARAKLDRLTLRSLASASLKDGTYQDRSLGYAGDVHVTVVIQGGRIADVKLRHEEKIDQNACVLLPQRIVELQSLQLDTISGATVTQNAIINGTYRCLKKAGLR